MEPYKVETIMVDGVPVNIYSDPYPLNPRADYDPVGTIYYVSHRYTLGDKQVSSSDLEEIWKEAEEAGDHVFPVYAYIHSGVELSLGKFSCPWDSGMSGIFVIGKDELKHLDGTPYSAEEVLEAAESIIETYSDYLDGNVYEYRIVWNGEETGGCSGFFGYDHKKSGLLESAMSEIQYLKKNARRDEDGSEDPIGSITVQTRFGTYTWVPHESLAVSFTGGTGEYQNLGQADSPEAAIAVVREDLRGRAKVEEQDS